MQAFTAKSHESLYKYPVWYDASPPQDMTVGYYLICHVLLTTHQARCESWGRLSLLQLDYPLSCLAGTGISVLWGQLLSQEVDYHFV